MVPDPLSSKDLEKCLAGGARGGRASLGFQAPRRDPHARRLEVDRRHQELHVDVLVRPIARPRGDAPAPCKAVGPKAGATKRGERVTIKPLCTVLAKLTVSDGQAEDSDTVRGSGQLRGAAGWRTTGLPPLDPDARAGRTK